MIEAVNSSVASASILRAGAQQVNSTVAAQVDATAPIAEAPKAPYISPHITVDVSYNKAVLQIRDSDTGDVKDQFPTKSKLAEIRRAQAQQEQGREVARRQAKLQTAEISQKVVASTVQPQQQTVSQPQQQTVSQPQQQTVSQQQQQTVSQQQQPAPQANVVTVQDVVASAPPANNPSSLPSPQIATAALSAGAQSGQAPASAGVSVLA